MTTEEQMSEATKREEHDIDNSNTVTPPTEEVATEASATSETRTADEPAPTLSGEDPLTALGDTELETTSDDRLIAGLSYASQLVVPFILPLIILISESNKKRPFQRYHAVQSLGLALAITLISAAVSIGVLVIQIIPLIGQLIGLAVLCLTPFAGIGVIGLALYYGYKAYKGEYFRIPALTTFMEDQGWL